MAKHRISEFDLEKGRREQTARAALRRLEVVLAAGTPVRQSTRDAILKAALLLPTYPDLPPRRPGGTP